MSMESTETHVLDSHNIDLGAWSRRGGVSLTERRRGRRSRRRSYSVRMERAHSLLLNEEVCAQLGEHQRAEFIFEWLNHLKKLLPSTDRIDIKQNQRRLVDQLSAILIGSPGPPSRWLLAHCLALLYRLGDPVPSSLSVERCNDIIRSKDDSPAAVACLGALYEQLGRMLSGSFRDTLPTC
ncbi:hypothetical protein INR49_031448 [Caranx melampygus]|nr:hypothetical protein INR49_031448 [Caranx melampygus]